MPIDKITPYALNTTNDERLIKATEMTDALNVTVSSDSEGNGFVLKNAKGNTYISPLTVNDAIGGNTYEVIGSVTDLDEEFVYFFVHSNVNADHGIYRVSLKEDSIYYEIVFKSNSTFSLGFPQGGYVDAAITRIDVNQDGSMNTLIYFTDNHNPPRKINVQRAMENGTFTGYVQEDYEEFFDVCKTAPKGTITTTLNSNSLLKSNSIYGNSFSFCYQYVYKDGEVSATSNLSSPVFSNYVLNGSKDNGSPIDDEDNEINVFLQKGNKEVAYVNVLFRDNATNRFYKIGKFSATEDDSGGLNTSDVWYYNNSSTTHRLIFRNKGTYIPVSDDEALKDFDNVPLKARSVSFCNGRLFYGGYQEHYEYTSGINAKLTVSYDPIPTSALTKDTAISWKAGATHNFGLIFYDKKGRSGPVIDLGSVYVSTIGERSVNSEGLGRAKITVNGLAGTPPSWAESFNIVYGGNDDIETFKQYAVADGFASFYIDNDYDATLAAFDETDSTKNIFLSLKNWSGSSVSYVGSTEADYEYKYKVGDVLKVLRYTTAITSETDETYAYPTGIESKIVNKLILLADMTDKSSAEAIQAELDSLKANNQVEAYGVLLRRIKDAFTDQESLNEEQSRLKGELDDLLSTRRYKYGVSNPICFGNYAPCKGHFLEIQDIDLEGWSSADYEGHILPNGTTTANDAHTSDLHFHPIANWRKKVLVEINSPKRNVAKRVYRELNTFQLVSAWGSASFVLTDGDVYLKDTLLMFPTAVDTNSDNVLDDYSSRNLSSYRISYEAGSEKTELLESEHASHFFHSKASDHGHFKAINEDASTVDRSSSITYSDFQANDSKILRYSSFNLKNANYKDLPYKYGQIDRIFEEDGYMFVFQDSKVCKIPVSKQVITTASGQSLLALNTEILGEPVFYAGDYGSSGLQQAVVFYNGRGFFFDITSERVFRTGGDGLTPISDTGLASFLEDVVPDIKRSIFDNSLQEGVLAPRIVGGYDPDYDEYLLTVSDHAHYSAKNDAVVDFNGFTAAFNSSINGWTSFYSFKPSCYAYIGDNLITCKDTGGYLFWVHSDSSQYTGGVEVSVDKSKYYTAQENSIVEVVSSYNPSMVKVFEALALETNSNSWTAYLFTSDQSTSIDLFDVRERGRYAVIPRDSINNVFISLGQLSEGTTTNVLNFTSRISGHSIPVGGTVYIGSTSVSGNTGETVSSVSGRKQLTLSGNVTGTADDQVYVKLDSAIYGDPIRDYFCKIRLTHSSSFPFELFAVNTHYDRSMLGQEKGQ